MSAHIVDKAQRLLDAGLVAEHPDVRVFSVDSTSNTRYTVVIGGSIASCSCKAGQRGVLCSHLVAAGLLMDRGVLTFGGRGVVA